MQRKRLALFAVTSICLILSAFALPASVSAESLPAPTKIQAPNSPLGGQNNQVVEVAPYRTDRVLIKFTPGAAASVAARPAAEVARGESGLPTVDALNRGHAVREMKRQHTSFSAPGLAREIGLDRWYLVELRGPADAEVVAARYRNNPNIEAATPDYVAFPTAATNDPLYSSQWGHNNTGQMLDYCWSCGGHPAGQPVGTVGFDGSTQAAWDEPVGFGSSSVIVAILDSGVDAGHPDLNQMAGYDFGDNDTNPTDDSASPGHGTACAGIAAGIANNGLGVAGVAGGVTIMPLKVANSAGSLQFTSIQSALIYAGDNGADVASMSFGAAITSDPATDNALTYAYNLGVTLVATTGNNNESVIGYPAYHPLVIGVGAASPCGERKRSSSSPTELNPGVSSDPNGYTCDGERWWGSSYGPNIQDGGSSVDIIAPTISPTTDIQGAGGYDPGDYSLWFNGTSAAAPFISGVCALIKSANPSFTPAQVRDRLVNTADDVVGVESGAGWDRYSGYGMVNAQAAVTGVTATPPVADFSVDATSGNFPHAVNFTDLSTNTPTSWSWNFGDGNSSTAQNPSHSYSLAGSYTVSLTATNGFGSDTETKVSYITVTDPSAPIVSYATSDIPTSGSVSGNYTNTHASDNVRQTLTEQESGGKKNQRHSFGEHRWLFNVSSGTTVTFNVEASRSNNSEGDNFRFEYSTNNSSFTTLLTVNSATEQSYSASLPANSSGNLWIRVVDTDQTQGNRSLDNVQVDHMYIETITATATAPPVAEFVGSPTTGNAPLAVSFTDQSTEYPTSWSWNFGDGNTSTLQHPSHSYAAAGTYDVSLVATNGLGSGNITKVGYITVNATTQTIMHVENLVVTRGSQGKRDFGIAAITIWDASGNPVANATVTGFFSSPNTSSVSGQTGANGVVTLNGAKTRTLAANVCFEVTNVTLTNGVYNPAANVWTGRCEDGSIPQGAGPALTRAIVVTTGLDTNHPNPFNPRTEINFRLATDGPVHVSIFDAAGRRVAVLVDEIRSAGQHSLNWDATGHHSGVYFLRMVADGQTLSRKMMLVK